MEIIKKYKRKIIQLTTAILYNINFAGFKDATIYKGSLKSICVPGLNCYSCPGAIGSCPLGSFQSFLMQNKSNIFARVPFYIVGLLVIFGVIFGRVICGFLCPFGLIQELFHKIPTKKIEKNNFTYKLTYLKYFILVIFCIAIPLFLFYPGFCKYICPVGTCEAGIFFVARKESLRNAIGFLFSLKIIIALFIIIMSIFMYRFFCRFICPLGAFYSLFNKVSIFGLRVDKNKCISCDKCIKFCKMDIKKVGDRECINCGECKTICPTDAIK